MSVKSISPSVSLIGGKFTAYCLVQHKQMTLTVKQWPPVVDAATKTIQSIQSAETPGSASRFTLTVVVYSRFEFFSPRFGEKNKTQNLNTDCCRRRRRRRSRQRTKLPHTLLTESQINRTIRQTFSSSALHSPTLSNIHLRSQKHNSPLFLLLEWLMNFELTEHCFPSMDAASHGLHTLTWLPHMRTHTPLIR